LGTSDTLITPTTGEGCGAVKTFLCAGAANGNLLLGKLVLLLLLLPGAGSAGAAG
jgi:hypothetical protein